MEKYPTRDIKAVHIPDDYRLEVAHFLLPEWSRQYCDYILILNGMMNDRIDCLAREIYETYKNEEELIIIAVMNVF